MDMVEKVAQAVCLAQWGGYPLERKEREAWPQWAQALKVARAAIEAMREPTDDMIAAQRAGLSREFGMTVTDGYLHRIHDRIIDAALKEQEKVG